MERAKERISSFELIKVIAIIMIVICHSVPTERIEYHYATNDIWLFFVILFRQLGSIGNAIFIVASTWFLTENNKIKLNKIKDVIFNNQIISVLILIAILLAGYRFSTEMVIKQFFPFFFGNLWFINSYVFYYLLHGFLNEAIGNFKVSFRKVLACMLIYLILVNVGASFLFNDLIGFMIYHVLTFFLKPELEKRDMNMRRKTGKRVLLIGLFGWLIGAIVLNIIGIHIQFVGSRFYYWNRYINPFIMTMAYGAAILASCSDFRSRMINRLSGLSLPMYMITGNQLIRIYIDNYKYDDMCAVYGNTSLNCFIFVVVYSLIKFFLGIGVSFLYKNTISYLDRFIKRVRINRSVE